MPAWVKVLEAFVPGLPQTKGSARAFVVKGRAIITNDNPKAKPWQHAVAWDCSERLELPEPTGYPVFLQIDFYFDRPGGHYGRNGLLRRTAPTVPAKKPDIDKVLRVVLDALTGVLYRDDSQVIGLTVKKHFSAGPQRQGVRVAAHVEGAR